MRAVRRTARFVISGMWLFPGGSPT